MKKITLHNYEAFMLDHFEGTLSYKDKKELVLFLEKHPRLKEEFYEFEMLDLSDFETIPFVFENKEEIKQKAELDVLLIEHLEGIISKTNKKRLNELLKVIPNAIQEQNNYRKTILTKPNVTFPKKSKLKKRGIVIPMQFWYSAAAAIIGFIVIFDFSTKPQPQTYQANSITTISERIALQKVPTIILSEHLDNVSKDSLISNNWSTKKGSNKPEYRIQNNPLPKTNPTRDTNNKTQEINTNFIANNNTETKNDSLNITQQNLHTDLSLIKNNKLQTAKVENQGIKEISVKEFLQLKAKEKLFKDNTTESKDLNSNNIIASLANKLNNNTKTEVTYSTSKKEKTKTTHIKIGKFEYYRTKKA